ncbi:hypothetical protein F5J12DRAFT_786242 [Pisolithus orientalis]|uniref:uncharacterized protein n=1 Tax=Pisolithus orientalis TaxID=936130 RepID=UPI0022254C80|nr:uncharacterized protein F5J12DRAFT_786242 [Pisolithus orientalis]KAI5992010.1 hypothetical protein F5J12DRAFT_786242 [Pisolithus orientalis]
MSSCLQPDFSQLPHASTTTVIIAAQNSHLQGSCPAQESMIHLVGGQECNSPLRPELQPLFEDSQPVFYNAMDRELRQEHADMFVTFNKEHVNTSYLTLGHCIQNEKLMQILKESLGFMEWPLSESEGNDGEKCKSKDSDGDSDKLEIFNYQIPQVIVLDTVASAGIIQVVPVLPFQCYRIWGVEIAEECQVIGYGEWTECAQQFRGWFGVPSFTGTAEGCQITIYEEWSECAQQFRGWFCVQMDCPRLIRKPDHMKKSPPTGKNSWLCLILP